MTHRHTSYYTEYWLCTFIQMRKLREALDYAVAAQSLYPHNDEIAEMMDNIFKRIAAGQ